MFRDKLKSLIGKANHEKEGTDKKKIENLVAFVIILIITIIAINTIWNDDKKKSSKDDNNNYSKQLAKTSDIESTSDVSTSSDLEKKLEDILSQIQGVGKVKVFVNYSESSETVAMYNENSKVSQTEETDTSGGKRVIEETDTQKDIVYKESNGEKIPITQKIIQPKIEGAIVTAEGANNANTKANIIQAVEAVTGVATHKIQVFEMRSVIVPNGSCAKWDGVKWYKRTVPFDPVPFGTLGTTKKGMINFMKSLKKNQIIIYTFALMLVAAGYLNYTSKISEDAVETANEETYVSEVNTTNEEPYTNKVETADIGDATLVNSNDVIEENATDTNSISSNINDINTNLTSKNQNSTNTSNITVSENTVNETNITNTDSKSIETSSNVSSDEYFVKSKLERETMYSQMIESYENILNSSNALETQKQSATQEITRINETKNSIMICENLIKTKGFDNNVVFVNGESVSVIIGTKELKKEETAQIQNIISRELKANIENIHISTK